MVKKSGSCLIKNSYAGWNVEAQFKIINGADHFYMGYLDKLETILTVHLEVSLGQNG